MRPVVTVVLACAVIMMVCVPTTHAMQHDPGKPTADKIFQPHTSVVADDGGWVDLKSGESGFGSWFTDFQRVIAIYYDAFFRVLPATHQGQGTSTRAVDSEIGGS